MQRREFILTVAAAGGAALLQICRAAATSAAPVNSWAASVWLEFFSDGSVVIRVHKSEMGQGVTTALPMLVAEELELPLSRVRVELAPGRREFRDARGNQTTGYSSSTSSNFLAFQIMGATAREMLLAAAAMRLAVPRNTLQAKDGWIGELASDGRRLGYFELLDTARAIAVPSAPTLKPRAARRVIGQSPTRVDTPAKVDGSAIFGIDVHVPGARVACIARCPMLGGKLQSYDARAALRQRGVQAVVPISNGLAVVARDFWAAQRGREMLKVRWQSPQNATADSAAQRAKLFAALAQPGLAGQLRGNLQALDSAVDVTARVLSADYWTPFLAHAAMEPLAATAHVQKERCDIWLGTQAPSRAQDWGAKIAGLPVDSVFVHNHYIGGAFGRRGEWATPCRA